MTPEETKQMHSLCDRIQVEKDHAIFLKLVQDLNDLLARKDRRMTEAERKAVTANGKTSDRPEGS
jgi:hypothetical protein